MKKVLFVFAFVAVYGVSMAISSSPVTSIDETITVVADADDKVEKEEGKKATKAEAKKTSEAKAEACSESKAKAESCSGTKAKAEACSGEKSAKKSGCASSCSGSK